MFRLVVGVLLIAFGLSTGLWQWVLSPGSNPPFLQLAATLVGVAVLLSGVRRRRRDRPVSRDVVIGGAAGAAVLIAAMYGILKELEQKREKEREAATLKLIELEQNYLKVKDKLTPEQRRFFEEKIAEYKQAFGMRR